MTHIHHADVLDASLHMQENALASPHPVAGVPTVIRQDVGSLGCKQDECRRILSMLFRVSNVTGQNSRLLTRGHSSKTTGHLFLRSLPKALAV
jgi:hypothetical protein